MSVSAFVFNCYIYFFLEYLLRFGIKGVVVWGTTFCDTEEATKLRIGKKIDLQLSNKY